MDIVICDVCSRQIDQPKTHSAGARFEFPLFQSPEKYSLTLTDLCMSCGLALSNAYRDLKEKRRTTKR